MSYRPPLTQADLSNHPCDLVGCENKGMWLHPACHPKAGLSAIYVHGALRIECKVCEKLVANIAVAP